MARTRLDIHCLRQQYQSGAAASQAVIEGVPEDIQAADGCGAWIGD